MLTKGTQVLFYHYLNNDPIAGVVSESDGTRHLLETDKSLLLGELSAGDPAVMGFIGENQLNILGCNIGSTDAEKSRVELVQDGYEPDSVKRLYQRYPVSYYANLKLTHVKRRVSAIVKDISKYGMLVYSREEIPNDTSIEIEIFLEKKMVFIDGKVVRRSEGKHYNEYGINVSFTNMQSLNELKKLLMQSKEDYIDRFVGKLAGSSQLTVYDPDAVFATQAVEGKSTNKLDASVQRLDDIIRRSRL